jgi:hypothetical protein
MAMNMTGEVQLPASRETVWAMLNEPAVLKSCIPGCESLDQRLCQRIPGGRHDQDRPRQGALERESEVLKPRSPQQLQHLR